MEVKITAPYFGNPAPSGPKGAFMKLWEFEVVEAFFLGDEDRYLELEFGPHGHHQILILKGKVHNALKFNLETEYTCEIGILKSPSFLRDQYTCLDIETQIRQNRRGRAAPSSPPPTSRPT